MKKKSDVCFGSRIESLFRIIKWIGQILYLIFLDNIYLRKLILMAERLFWKIYCCFFAQRVFTIFSENESFVICYPFCCVLYTGETEIVGHLGFRWNKRSRDTTVRNRNRGKEPLESGSGQNTCPGRIGATSPMSNSNPKTSENITR